MAFKWIILFLIIMIGKINSAAEEENNDNNEQAKEIKRLKRNGCPMTKRPNDMPKWTLMKQNSKNVKGVCIKRGYRVTEAPTGEANVTTVYKTFYRTKVLEVDETQKTVTIDLKLSSIWEDDRIKTPFLTGNTEIQLDTTTSTLPIWNPGRSTYIANLKERKLLYDPIAISELTFLSNNPFNRSTDTALVKATFEWRVTVFCEFNFLKFPLDNQRCELRSGSKGSGDIKSILYAPDDNKNCHSEKPFEADGYNMTIVFVGSTQLDENGTNEFGFDITMQRQIQPYLFQYYLPCISIVVVSCISFIVPLTAIPGRIALVVTQFLTLTNIFIHQMSDSPSSSDLNALGRYLMMSLFFVFGTMIEFAVVLVVKRKLEWDKNESNGRPDGLNLETTTQKNKDRHVNNVVPADVVEGKGHNLNSGRNGRVQQKGLMVKKRGFFKVSSLTDKIDFTAFVVFIFGYFVFNCVYLMHYKQI